MHRCKLEQLRSQLKMQLYLEETKYYLQKNWLNLIYILSVGRLCFCLNILFITCVYNKLLFTKVNGICAKKY